jgi:DNA-binding response OmpR family regulator
MTEHSEQANGTSEDKPLALVIEDDPHLAYIFGIALSKAGYRTEIIGDGQEALQWLVTGTPTLVVLDLHLPHVSGLVILEYIRSRTQLSHTRVILATADALKAEVFGSKADLILLKPISFQQLRDLAARLRPDKPE